MKRCAFCERRAPSRSAPVRGETMRACRSHAPRLEQLRDRFAHSTQAVAPVAGVVLLIILAVVFAGLVYGLATSMADATEPGPMIAFIRDGEDYGVVKAPRGLYWSQFAVTGCDSVPTGTLDAGDVLRGCQEGAEMQHRASGAVVWKA